MDNNHRANEFKKNSEAETILSILDHHLSGVEEKLTHDSLSSKYQPIFIFGCARSGTTVLHQYLIQNISCIYPSNFLSRFYYAPYLGGLYYKMFTQLDTRGELLGDVDSKSNFSSDLGKTEGIHSPNEFWYFWRNHFEINKKGTIDISNIDQTKVEEFKKSIFALQNLFNKPFITKGMIANNCIDLLEDIFPEAIFVHLQRDVIDNARSLYNARLKFFGTAEKWYSFYPNDPAIYEQYNPIEQVVRQIIDTNIEIQQSLERCQTKRIITIKYSSFCRNPEDLLNCVAQMSDKIECRETPMPAEFNVRRRSIEDENVEQEISKVVDNLT